METNSQLLLAKSHLELLGFQVIKDLFIAVTKHSKKTLLCLATFSMNQSLVSESPELCQKEPQIVIICPAYPLSIDVTTRSLQARAKQDYGILAELFNQWMNSQMSHIHCC